MIKLINSTILARGFTPPILYNLFDAFHNMIMDLLASQGIVGIVLFIFIIIHSLESIIKCFRFASVKKKNECAYLFSVCMAVVASSMFVSEILYVNNQITVIFWILWGYLNKLCSEDIYENTSAYNQDNNVSTEEVNY